MLLSVKFTWLAKGSTTLSRVLSLVLALVLRILLKIVSMFLIVELFRSSYRPRNHLYNIFHEYSVKNCTSHNVSLKNIDYTFQHYERPQSLLKMFSATNLAKAATKLDTLKIEGQILKNHALTIDCITSRCICSVAYCKSSRSFASHKCHTTYANVIISFSHALDRLRVKVTLKRADFV